MGGGLDGREQRRGRILAGHAQELPQGQRRLELAAALEGREVGVDLGQQAAQVLLFGERRAIVPAPAREDLRALSWRNLGARLVDDCAARAQRMAREHPGGRINRSLCDEGHSKQACIPEGCVLV